jgi:hypothetical protein
MRSWWILIQSITLGYCLAQQPVKPKPPCNAQNRGQIWPAHNQRDACQPVEMCTLNVWKYRWTSVTVPVWQLAKDPKRKSVCKSTQLSNSSLGD